MSRIDLEGPGRRRKALAVLLACLVAGAAFARSSDRGKEMLIEAGHQSGTFAADSVNVLSGGVRVRQGTLDISSGTASITVADGDPVRAVFSGSPVVLKQVMDDGTPMTARADNVDYNLRTETVVFTGNVNIEQPRGSMRGARVVYNLQTGNVESGGEGNGRVHLRILPKAAREAGEGQ
ncbi:MAG TPA: lipopolysaccharide transport periplasmic protein LptA [Luteimonas sp.]|nr:lipopolysaccharide transport periplasmic protein LptA [Luteimonas sp.]